MALVHRLTAAGIEQRLRFYLLRHPAPDPDDFVFAEHRKLAEEIYRELPFLADEMSAKLPPRLARGSTVSRDEREAVLEVSRWVLRRLPEAMRSKRQLAYPSVRARYNGSHRFWPALAHLGPVSLAALMANIREHRISVAELRRFKEGVEKLHRILKNVNSPPIRPEQLWLELSENRAAG